MKQSIRNLGNSIFPEIPFLTDFSQAWRQLARNQQLLPEKHHPDMFLFWLTTQTQGPSFPPSLTHILCHSLKQLIACDTPLGCHSQVKKGVWAWIPPKSGYPINLLFSLENTSQRKKKKKNLKTKTFHRNFFVLSKQPFSMKAKQSWPAQLSFLHALLCLQDRNQLKGLQKQIGVNWGEQKLGLSTHVWDLHFDTFIFRRLRLFLNIALDSAPVASTAPTLSSPAVPHPCCCYWGRRAHLSEVSPSFK